MEKNYPSFSSSWKNLSVEKLAGPNLVVGDTDTGKSTLVKWISKRLRKIGQAVAFLDGDPGQSKIGGAGTITLQRSDDRARSWFVGSTSPRGNMLSIVMGARRLAEEVSNDAFLVYDTSGLVVPEAGGRYLKWSLIDLVEPGSVLALQRYEELEDLLEPLRRRENFELYELPVPDAVTEKSQKDRLQYRQKQYQDYFENAAECSLQWTEKAVRPEPDLEQNQVVGLCGQTGLVEGLGLVMDQDPDEKTVSLQTPIEDTEAVKELRLGEFRVDPNTYRDEIDF